MRDLALVAQVVGTLVLSSGLALSGLGVAGTMGLRMDLAWAERFAELGLVLGLTGMLPMWWSWIRVAGEGRGRPDDGGPDESAVAEDVGRHSRASGFDRWAARHPLRAQVVGTASVSCGLGLVTLSVTASLNWAAPIAMVAWILAAGGLLPMWCGWLALAGQERRNRIDGFFRW